MKLQITCILLYILSFSNGFQHCKQDNDCPTEEYCDALSGVCLPCSCCCPDEITQQDYIQFDKCVEEMPPYLWCRMKEPEYTCECDISTTTVKPVTQSASTSPESTSRQPTSEGPTTTPIPNQSSSPEAIPTTGEPINTTSAHNTTTGPDAKSNDSWKIVVVATVCALVVLAVIILGVLCKKKCCGRRIHKDLSPGQSYVNLREDMPLSDQPGRDISVNTIAFVPDEVEHSDHYSEEGEKQLGSQRPDSDADNGHNPNVDEDQKSKNVFDNVDNDDEYTFDENSGEEGHSDEIQLIRKTRKIRIKVVDLEKKCHLTVAMMMENRDLMDELKTCDVTINGRCAAEHLASKFAKLSSIKIKYIQQKSSMTEPATTTIFEIIKSKNPGLKCVRIVKLLHKLGRNDVVIDVIKINHECEACGLYYRKIANNS